MDSEQPFTPGQVNDPGVNFASVFRLMSATNHRSCSLPWGNFKRGATRYSTPKDPLCEQNAKVASGQE